MTTSKPSTTNYTIERVTSVDQVDGALASFIVEEAKYANLTFDNKFNYEHFRALAYAERNLFLVCRRKGEPVGFVLGRLYRSIFDPDCRILFQDSLYAKPGSGRAAWLLLKAFVDFGKANADHIFTVKTKFTNIKGRSLEKFGFTKAEELYRMET